MRYFFIVFLLLPFLLPAQKLRGISYNKSKQKVIETFALSVKESSSAVTTVKLKAVGPVYYAYISGYGLGVSNITARDQAFLVLDNDSAIALSSTGRQSYWYRDKGLNSYQHRYIINRNDLEALSQYNLKGIRKSAGDDYTYISVSSRYQERAKKLSKLFLKYLPKTTVADVAKEPIAAAAGPVEASEPKTAEVAPGANIRLDEAAQHIGDSVTVCGKVYTARYLERSKGQPTLLNVGAAFPNQPLTIVIFGESRGEFSAAPEQAYNDKEICVTGVLQLYNEKPQIVVRKKEQILLK